MTAVQAVAARAGAPLGGDFAVLSLSDRLKPWEVIERRLVAVPQADLVLAVYNPASRSRTTQVADMQRILLQHKDPDTVVVVGRDVGGQARVLEVTTLGELDAGEHRHAVPADRRLDRHDPSPRPGGSGRGGPCGTEPTR